MLSPSGFSRVIVMDDEDPEAILVVEIQVFFSNSVEIQVRFLPEE